MMRKLREGIDLPNYPKWWGLGLLLLLDVNYTCMISALLLLHMCPQYITPAAGILSNHTFYVCWQVKKLYFGMTGLLILEILARIIFFTPRNCFPWLNCKQPLRLYQSHYSNTKHVQCILCGLGCFFRGWTGHLHTLSLGMMRQLCKSSIIK